jgi:hypothetical protein
MPSPSNPTLPINNQHYNALRIILLYFILRNTLFYNTKQGARPKAPPHLSISEVPFSDWSEDVFSRVAQTNVCAIEKTFSTAQALRVA